MLVGVAVGIKPGTLTQLICGTTFMLCYLMIQIQARPFKNLADNFIALAASFFLLALFLCCVLLKLGTLTEIKDVYDRLSATSRDVYHVPVGMLTVGLFFSILGALALSAIILVHQIADDTRRAKQLKLLKERDAQVKRLRYTGSGEVVKPPELKDGIEYHLFLSHVSVAHLMMHTQEERVSPHIFWSPSVLLLIP